MHKERYKNIWFYIGIGSVIISAMGVDVNTLTSWNAVFTAIKEMFCNPLQLTTVALAVLSVWIDPTTKGIKDGAKFLEGRE